MITVMINEEDIIFSGNSHEEIFDIIKKLELKIGDVGFTEELAKYFNAEVCKEYAKDDTFNAQELLPEEYRKK